MKHFFTVLKLRLCDLVVSFGTPPYGYIGTGGNLIQSTYSLEKALALAPLDPNTTTEGSKTGMRYVMIGCMQHDLRQDRFGRVHLPKVIKDRLFAK